MRFVGSITLAIALVAPAVRAEAEDADRLFEEGRALAKTGNFALACDRFAKSLAIERTIGTELNLADCRQQLGELREAWGLFVAAAGEAEAAGDAKRAKFAHDRAAALEPKMANLIVRVAQPAQPGLVITISGRDTAPAAEIHEHVNPGEIDVIATAPNLPHVKKTETGTAGATVIVEIPPLDRNAAVTKIRPSPIVVPGPRSRGRVHLAYGLGIGAGVAGVAAVALTFIGRNHYTTAADGPDCNRVTGGIICNDAGNAKISDAQRLADFGTGCAIGGGLLVGAAIAIYLTAPSEGARIVPTANPNGVGVTITGGF